MISFKADVTVIRKALAHVQGVVERRKSIPILENVLFTVRGGSLTLTGTDMEIALVETVQAACSGDGAFTAPAATLYDIVRKLPASALVEFEHAGGGEMLSVRSGRYATKLQTLPTEDFPSMTTGSLPVAFNLDASTLLGLITHTAFAMSTEETRYYLGGIYMHAAHGALRAVATDGHRLARVEAELPAGAADMPGVIIPRKTIGELRKLLDTDAAVAVFLSETRIQFSIGDVTLTSKLIDGTFPEYERVIPRGNDRTMRVAKSDFASAVGRVSAIASAREAPIKLALSAGSLALSATDASNGTASEEISAEYDGAPMEIGFQARYLTDITDQIGDRVEFLLGSDGSSPAILKDADDAATLYVLMPMRV